MADQNKPVKRKSDGIVTSDSIKKVRETLSNAGQEATFNLLQQVEPKYFEYLINKINDDKDKLRQRGVTGKQLQLVADIMLTYGIDGFLQYRSAVNAYDADKLTQIYGKDYEAWEDSLIDEFLKKKKEQEAQAPEGAKAEAKPPIEPEHSKKKPGDLLDSSDIG